MTILLGIIYLPVWNAKANGYSESGKKHRLLPGFPDRRDVDLKANQEESPTLELGKVIERAISNGEAHRFRAQMEAGQYLRVFVEQQGVDLEERLFSPDDHLIAEMNGPYDKQGEESVSLVAEESGLYKIEIRKSREDESAGHYSLKTEVSQSPSQADISRINGERAFMKGRKLAAQPGADNWLSAIKHFEDALKHWRTSESRQLEATTLYIIGVTYRRNSKKQDALVYLNQALSLQRAIVDNRGAAYTLNALAFTQFLLTNPKAGREYLLEALPIWKAEKDQENEAVTLNMIGGAHDNSGEPQKALEYYNQALEIRLKLDDYGGQVSTYTNIGVIYDEFGDSQKALENYSLALSAIQRISNPGREQVATKAKTLNNIGYTYFALGDSANALEFFKQALLLQRETEDSRGEGITLLNIGNVYSSSGDSQNALKYYDNALQINKKTDNQWSLFYTFTYTGNAYALLGDMQRALEYYNRAMNMRQGMDDRQGEAIAFNNLGNALIAVDQPDKALENLEQALSLWRALGDRRGEAAALWGIARLERNRGKFVEALGRISGAIDIIESLRTKVTDQNLRASYFASIRDYYDLKVDLLMQLARQHPSENYKALAIEVSERARARGLLDLLTEAHADIQRGIAPDLLAHERELQRLLNAKAYQIQMFSSKATDEQKAAVSKEMNKLLAQYHEVQAQIRTTSPRYAALTQPEPLTLKEIQQQVLDPDTMLLEYSLGNERSYLWAVTQDSIASYELPKRVEIESVAEKVKELQHLPGEPTSQYQARAAGADSQFQTQAARLSQILLGPAAMELGNKRLVIVVEGILQYISFSALPVPAIQETGGKGPESATIRPLAPGPRPPLIAEHEVISLPSASALAVLRRETSGRAPALRAVAVLADPVFDKNDRRVKLAEQEELAYKREASLPPELGRALRDFDVSREGESLQRLSSSREEAEKILSVTPAKEGFEAVDFKASRATVESTILSQFRIIHFATHGLLNSEHPELSGIVLSLVNEKGEPQNGFLRLHDIYNLNLPAELVVLSACQTGLGKDIRGEGLVGLTRGFMYAGAERVVASLWKVDDVATSQLMKLFYQGMLREGLRPAAALRKAQVEMQRRKRWEAPYYWAAFVLQGEWK